MDRRLRAKMDLHDAIRSNNLDLTKRIITNDDPTDYAGTLYIAAKLHHNKILTYLLNNVNVHTHVSLYRALDVSIYVYNIDAIKLLIELDDIRYMFSFPKLFDRLNIDKEKDESIKKKKEIILDLLFSSDKFMRTMIGWGGLNSNTLNKISYTYKKRLYEFCTNEFNFVTVNIFKQLFEDTCKYDDVNYLKYLLKINDKHTSIENILLAAIYYISPNIIKYLLDNFDVDFNSLKTTVSTLSHEKRIELFDIFLIDGRILRIINYNTLNLKLRNKIKRFYNLKTAEEVKEFFNIIIWI